MDIKEGFVICDNSTKNKILKEVKGFKSYTFLSYQTLISKLLGQASKRSIIELKKNFSLTYDLAKKHLEVIPFIGDKSYNSHKLNELKKEKEYLINNGLFKRDEFFYYKLKNTCVTFINPKSDKLFITLKTMLDAITTVYVIENETLYPLAYVYQFKDIYNELLYCFSEIKRLHSKSVSYNNIYIANTRQSYTYLLKRLSISYNIPLNFKNEKNILRMPIVKSFIEMSKENLDYTEIFSKLDKTSSYYKTLLNIVNDYQLVTEGSYNSLELVLYLLKNVKLDGTSYVEMVNVTNDYNYGEDDYVFYVGFNLGYAPRVILDEGFLNDNENKELGLNTSTELNVINKEHLINSLKGVKNLYISLPLTEGGKDALPSLLISELGLEYRKTNNSYGDSKTEDAIRLAVDYNNYIKFNNIADSLKIFDIDYLNYGTYSNSFKGINQDIINEYFNNNRLRLSYSSVKEYYQCPFRFYGNNILRLDDYQKSLAQIVGSYAHSILEDSYKEDFDFDESILKHKEKANNKMELFYFKHMDEIVKALITFNKEHEEKMTLNNVKCEEVLEFDEADYHFKGVIDKLLYTVINDIAYAVIIDYKTGGDKMSLNNYLDGFNLQLPIYMYILSKLERFKGLKVCVIGIYLQKVNITKLNTLSDVYSQLSKAFMLNGYTIKNAGLIDMIDPNYNNSDYIQSMKTTSKGFSHYTKLLDERDQEKLISDVSNLISKCSSNIHKGIFPIEPKRIDGKNESCTFCKLSDVCNRIEDNFIDLEKKPFGGEEDGVDE